MSEKNEEAKQYNRIKVRLKLIDIGFLFLYLTLFQIFASPALKTAAFSWAPGFHRAFTIYLIAFSLSYYIISFPLNFYASFILEHRFKLSNQRFFNWLKDDIKKGLLSLCMFLIFMHALYIFLRTFESTWWVWIAVFWFAATIFLARISPVFIVPLFFKYFPVEDGLKSKIIELSKKCGIKILDVYKIDFSKKTNKLNAAVIGLGKTRRVLLADNLVRDFNAGEIAGVLAHEFAHHKLRHMWKSIAFGIVSIFFSFYVLYLVSSGLVAFLNAENIYDMGIFPAFMLILSVAGLVMLPVQNGFSRVMEKEADLFALRVTGDKNSFISLMKKLAERNLADPNPPKVVKFFFYDHPPISERVKLAEAFKEA